MRLLCLMLIVVQATAASELDAARLRHAQAMAKANTELFAAWEAAIAEARAAADDATVAELGNRYFQFRIDAARLDPQPHAWIKAIIADDLIDVQGNAVDCAAYLKGADRVVLYFSASWCGPCKAFTPQLIEFAKVAQDQGSRVILVGADRDAKSMRSYMHKMDMPWPGIPPGSRAHQAIEAHTSVSAIPCLIVLNDQGEADLDARKSSAGAVLSELQKTLPETDADKADAGGGKIKL